MDDTTKKIFDCLRTSRYCEHFSDEKIFKIVSNAELRKFDSNHTLIAQGEHNTNVFFLSDGKVLVIKDDLILFHFARIGDVFGETEIISENPSSTKLKTITPVEVVTVPCEFFKRIQQDTDHELHPLVRKFLSEIFMDKSNLASYERLDSVVLDDGVDAKTRQQFLEDLMEEMQSHYQQVDLLFEDDMSVI